MIVRRDLPIGVICAQLTHAAGESTEDFHVPSGTYAVVLAVDSEKELLDVHTKLNNQSIKHVLIREPDNGFNNQAMTIGLFPSIKTKEIKKTLSCLKLLK